MTRSVRFILVGLTVLLLACDERIGGYVALSSITEAGFARQGKSFSGQSGQEMLVWGFVDHHNIYGDGRARDILEEWWGGEGPGASNWRFNVKAKADDTAGRSFAVRVPEDPGRDQLLRVFVEDARAGRPTRVFLRGRIYAFDAPTNLGVLTGLRMELHSSRDILLELPDPL